MIKDYKAFINEKAYIDEFLRLYNLAPDSLKKEIDDTKKAEQNPYWHPEGNTYIHIRLVTNRLANCYKDINLNLAGLFHDLGKTETTKFDDEKQTWTAYNHEEESVNILHKYKDWVKEMGGDFDIIEFIVANHMRYKYLEEFRLQEQINFINHPYFKYVEKFATADYGGTDLTCKEIPGNKEIKDKINNFLKKEKEDKIISSKFNGRMVMDKYPNLKGVELGKSLNDFKNSFDDFREFALNNSSEEIMKKFDEFIQKVNESLRDKMKPKSEDDIEKGLDDLFDRLAKRLVSEGGYKSYVKALADLHNTREYIIDKREDGWSDDRLFRKFSKKVWESLRDKMKPKSEEEIKDIEKELDEIYINQNKAKYSILKYLKSKGFNFNYDIEYFKKNNFKSGYSDIIGSMLIFDFIKEHKKIIPNFNNLSINEQDLAWDKSIEVITEKVKEILKEFDFKLISFTYGQGDLLIKFEVPNDDKYIVSKTLPKISIDSKK